MAMNVFTKSIKRLIGWCPNAKALEIGSQITPANFEIYMINLEEKKPETISAV